MLIIGYSVQEWIGKALLLLLKDFVHVFVYVTSLFNLIVSMQDASKIPRTGRIKNATSYVPSQPEREWHWQLFVLPRDCL